MGAEVADTADFGVGWRTLCERRDHYCNCNPVDADFGGAFGLRGYFASALDVDIADTQWFFFKK